MGDIAKTCDVVITICKDGRHHVSCSSNTPAILAQELRSAVSKAIDEHVEKYGEVHIK